MHHNRTASTMSRSVLLRTGIVPDAGSRPVNGEGCYVVLEDGRRVVDASATPLALGHRHPRILEAVGRALKTSPTLDEGFSTSLRESTAEELLGTVFAGEDWAGAVRFALTGSEANDLALSLAQAITGRNAFVTRERAYHGMVGLARDITVQPQWHGGLSSRSGGSDPFLQVPPSEPCRSHAVSSATAWHCHMIRRKRLWPMRNPCSQMLPRSSLIHPGGLLFGTGLSGRARWEGEQHGYPWIADEVVTGFGKGGRWLNFQRGDKRPDMVTLGKSMVAAGAAAAIILSKDLLERIGDSSWSNYSSLRASDLSAAAAREFIRVIDEEDLVTRADSLHDSILAGMRTLAAAHPSVSRVDGWSALVDRGRRVGLENVARRRVRGSACDASSRRRA